MNNQEQQISIEELIEKTFDFSIYNDTEKKALIEEMSAQLMEVTVLRSIDEGGQDMQEKFNKFIVTEPSEEQMSNFVNDNIPNFGTVMLDEIKSLQEITEGKNTTQ